MESDKCGTIDWLGIFDVFDVESGQRLERAVHSTGRRVDDGVGVFLRRRSDSYGIVRVRKRGIGCGTTLYKDVCDTFGLAGVGEGEKGFGFDQRDARGLDVNRDL